MQANDFSPYVRILARGKNASRSLTQPEAHAAMALLLRQQCTPEQMGAFLMLLRVQEETAEEMAGFVAACREVIAAPAIQVDLDWSSYAGKRRHLPWFLLAALLAAENGVRVFMHGTGGHMPDRIYTAESLQSLGIPLCHDWSAVQQQLDNTNFAYMPLSALCPRLEHIIQMRPLFGVRSPVNSFSRMINPLAAPHSFHSIFHPPYLARHQEACALLGDANVYVIKGDGGEAERNPDRPIQIASAIAGQLHTETWTPLLNKRSTNEEDMRLEQLKQLWHGDIQHEYGEQSVIATLAVVLHQLGRANSQDSANQLAQQWWQARNKARF